MKRTPQRSSGFTLVEVLVSLLVFSLLAATAYASLNALTRVADDYRARSEDLAGLQRAVATLDADLRQLTSRLGRDREGRVLPVLQGGPASMLGRRAGRANPAALPRSQLQQVRWLVSPGGLVRQAWPEVDSAPSSPPSGQTVYRQVRGVAFRYRDAAGVWHSTWPAGAGDALPTAIEYALETPRFGRLRRLVAL